jgi:molybdate transport system substrate-binding protein
MKDGKNMRKKLIAAMMAGVLSAGMLSTGVFAADTDLKGEVNTFIAASLSNAMEEIQKDFNETYPDVEELNLKVGSDAYAVIKATNVMVGIDE